MTHEDGRARHRAVYVGGDDQVELLDRVRRYLAEVRAPARWPAELAAYADWSLQLRNALQRLSPTIKRLEQK
ncbi:MAG: hypothetical protein JNM56_34195 [Planctomycetia bacterium]|nr:hypothetical protein [Planctomycetia bacterium]